MNAPPPRDDLFLFLDRELTILEQRLEATTAEQAKRVHARKARFNAAVEKARAEFTEIVEARRATNSPLSNGDVNHTVNAIKRFEATHRSAPLKPVFATIAQPKAREALHELKAAFASIAGNLDSFDKEIVAYDEGVLEDERRDQEQAAREEEDKVRAALAKQAEHDALLKKAQELGITKAASDAPEAKPAKKVASR